MKIEGWSIHQTKTGTEISDNTVRTEFSFVTNDDIDRDTFLDHIRLYDKSTTEPFDLDFYLSMKKFAEEDKELHEFYTGKSPSQIKEICDEIYHRIHKFLEQYKRSPQINWEYRKLNTGIEILRVYNIWWTPPVESKEVEEHDSESVENNS